jgi:hypothetical protein
MRWIKIVWWKNAISIYRNIFDNNLRQFSLRFRNFRSSIICDLMNVSLIWFYTAISYWSIFLSIVNQWCFLRRISVHRQSRLIMMKIWFVLIKNLRNSFLAAMYEILNADSCRLKDRIYTNFFASSKFWTIFNILWFNFLDDRSICMFLLNNQIRFFIW